MKLLHTVMLGFLWLLGASCSQEPKSIPIGLKVGDSPPPLAGTNWIKGEPVASFEPGKVYLIEFWATWCEPCIAIIPHLTELQAAFASEGLIVIGQNVWERDSSLAKPFVEKMGRDMNYRVVLDDLSTGLPGKMATTWMAAAGRDGIPCSVIIGRDGKLAWIGHPMEAGPVLRQVLAGTFDAQRAVAERSIMEKFQTDLRAAMNQKEWDRALQTLDEVSKVGWLETSTNQLDLARFNILLEKKDYAAAYRTGARLTTAFHHDPVALNEIAWTIVDKAGLERRDLDLAERAATRAVELTQSNDAAILDTMARVRFEQGRLDEAIELQTAAVAKSSGAVKSLMKTTLEQYKRAKVWRRPAGSEGKIQSTKSE